MFNVSLKFQCCLTSEGNGSYFDRTVLLICEATLVSKTDKILLISSKGSLMASPMKPA